MLNDIEVNQVASQKIMQYGYWLIRFWKNVYYAVRRTTQAWDSTNYLQVFQRKSTNVPVSKPSKHPVGQ